MCGGDSCQSCAALAQQVAALEVEVQELQSIVAYLTALIQKARGYAHRTQRAMAIKITTGGMPPHDYNFARGAEAVAGRVGEILDGK